MVALALDLVLEVAGEQLQLNPDGSLYWPKENTLFVADLHLGKAAAFRAVAVPVPTGSTNATLLALSAALEGVPAQRLVILGDMWHNREALAAVGAFQAWRDQYPALDVHLILGNHDKRAGHSLGENIRVSEEGERLGPFSLCHYPSAPCEPYILSGHIHPGVRLGGKGRQSETFPCFWFSETVGVLPAFGDFTGLGIVRPGKDDRVAILAGGEIYWPG